MSLSANLLLAVAVLAALVPGPLAAWSLWKLGRSTPRWFEWALCGATLLLGLFRLQPWGGILLISALWLALLIRRVFQRPPTSRWGWLGGGVGLVGTVATTLLFTVVASLVVHFAAGPRPELMRALCKTSQGYSSSLFFAKAWALNFDVGRGLMGKYGTESGWIFMHYGCEVTFDDTGAVKRAQMWSWWS